VMYWGYIPYYSQYIGGYIAYHVPSQTTEDVFVPPRPLARRRLR